VIVRFVDIGGIIKL